MHKQMKQNPWVRFMVFVGILLALIQVCSYIPRQASHFKNGNFWPYFYQEVPRNSLDIVFMGNSHAKTTFIPEIIDQLLGTHSLHVNTSGESIFQTLIEFREVLRTQDPQMVVLEANPIYNGLTREELKPWNFSFFYAMPFGFRKLAAGLQFFSDLDLMKFLLPFTSNHADWKNPGAVFERAQDALQAIEDKLAADWHVDLPHKGYENYLRSLPLQPETPAADLVDGCAITDLDARLAAAAELLQIAQKEGQAVTLIEAPQYINPYATCREPIAATAERYGSTYLTLFVEPYRSPLWFGDDEHMTQFGAIIASVETAQFLADKLDIAINRDMLAYYRSYFYRDYTLEQTGNTVTLTLIPEDEAAIQAVDFAWDVSLNGDIIFESDGKGMNQLSFTLPDAKGEYFLHVVIHNPISSYYLRGGFELVLE